MRKDWCVVGAGGVGMWVVFDAILYYNAAVTVVDTDPSKLTALHQKLESLLGKKAANFVCYLGSMDDVNLAQLDVIVSCAPHRINRRLAELAIQHRIHYADLGGNNPVTISQYVISHERHAQSSVVPDNGVSPGLSNILAVDLVTKHGCDVIHVYCGGNPLHKPQKKRNPYVYRAVFSPEGLASEYCGTATEIVNGKLEQCKGLSRITNFSRLYQSAPTANNSHFVAKHLLSRGVKEYAYETLRYYSHFDEIKKSAPLHCERAVADWFRSVPEMAYNPKKHRDRLTLIVEGWRLNDPSDKHSHYIDVAYDSATGAPAMGHMTAAGISMVANQLALGNGPVGFALPEECMDTAKMVSELNERLKLVPNL